MRFALCILALVWAVGWRPLPALTAQNPPARPAAGPVESRSGRTSPGTTARTALVLPLTDAGVSQCDSTAATEDLLASAREMFVADNYSLAEMLYLCVLDRDPNDLSAILELSVVYEAAGKLQYARGLLRRASVLRPYDQEIIDRNTELANKLSKALEVEVDSLLSQGAFEAAIPKLSALVGERPGDADLYYKKAQCYLELGNADEALVEIEKAVGIRDDVRYFVLRSRASKLNAANDVSALIQEARELSTSNRGEDRDRILALLSQILARNPDNEWAKKQFIALSNGDSTPHAAKAPNTLPRVVAFSRSAAQNTGDFVVGFFSSLGRDLGLLIAALVILIVFGSPLTSVIVRRLRPRQQLSGSLADFSVHAVLSLLHTEGKSGVLRIHAGAVKGSVYFVDGEIHHCAAGKAKDRDAIRTLLAGARDGYFALNKLPRSFARTMDTPFNLVLMDIGERSFLEPPRNLEPEPSLALQTKSKMKSLLENKS